jgi:hypothetical protein
MLGERKNEKGVRVMDLKCVCAKNEVAYVSMNHPYVLQHV